MIKEERDALVSQISEINRQMEMLRNLQANNYRKIKEEGNSRLARLEIKLTGINVLKPSSINIKKIVQATANTLSNLFKLYETASIEGKRYLVGSLFQKL